METRSALAHEGYAVGWICALPMEMAASQALLDERHPVLAQNHNDHNSYTLGRIGVHNVVMTCLPRGGTGTVSAAIVATEMASSFRNLQFVLLVGVGVGVLGAECDIRLGDVVVSHTGPNHGGVVQFDFGKAMQDGKFVPTNMLDRPPRILLAAVSQSAPITPGASLRSRATSNKSSGNQVMRHAMTRDRLRDEISMACFEMGAAGLMGQLPCLVIRGICDYADSHKNKTWQSYASAVVASYARELLSIIPNSTDAHPQVRTNTFGSESLKWRGKQCENKQDDGRKYDPLQSPEVVSSFLPGLVSRFQGCIQSFPELFLPQDASPPFRLTWEKLELEKVLLLQWAARVHLLDDR
ncbi:unnamed protein product [Clonostachys byssicola]|uniref:Nucleoside phosphorylase domain-containing protein n=1 Tax=Clonostachys byssicola TaxID=160290 RepID=A0A9N9UIW5_9HYPO|nr:unnamed protein product [Clonostachys byssicola]